MNNSDVKDYWEKLGEQRRHASTMDENDLLGNKNAYIAWLRDFRVLSEINHTSVDDIVVDLGCGEGSLSRTLCDAGYGVIGLDLSGSLLRLAQQQKNGDNLQYVKFDGAHIPIESESVNTVIVYEVLMYLNDDMLPEMLSEIRRILRRGGLFIVIEQCRRRTTYLKLQRKIQRTRSFLTSTLESADFAVRKSMIHRHGHFPLTYLIRWGKLTQKSWHFAQRMEGLAGRWFGILPCDYADVLFVCDVRLD